MFALRCPLMRTNEFLDRVGMMHFHHTILFWFPIGLWHRRFWRRRNRVDGLRRKLRRGLGRMKRVRVRLRLRLKRGGFAFRGPFSLAQDP
jgi:hypothetical protein